MTPNEIKQALIEKGWENNGETTASKVIGNKLFEYTTRNEALDFYFIVESDKFEEFVLSVQYPTLDRIEALVYGLTGEKV